MKRFLAIMLMVCCAWRAGAQPLVQSIPADALVYAAWSGSEHMGDGYEGSHLQGVMQASSMKDLFTKVMPALAELAAMEDDEAGAALELLGSLSSAAFMHPTAFYLGPIGVQGDEPEITFAIICDAGEDAPRIAGQLRAVIDDMGRTPVPVRVDNWGGRIALQVGNLKPMTQTRLGGPLRIVPAPSLKDHKPFVDAMAKVKGDTQLVVYIDIEAIMATVDAVTAKEAAQFAEQWPNLRNEAAEWPKMRDALGLSGLRRVALASGFAEKQWSDRVFIDAPSPRKGIATLLDSKPLSHDLLKLIPKDAAMAGVGQLDPGAVLDEVRNVADSLEPGTSAQINQAIADLEAQTGVNVENGLLKALGHEWGYYTAATIGGKGVGGLVLLNRPRDAEALQNSLDTIVAMANQIIAAQTQEMPVELQVRTMEVDGTTITYVPAFLMSPCWAMKDGVIYAALYPQVLVSALAREGGESILDNTAFTDLWKKTGVNPGGAGWVDLEQLAPEGYQGLLMLSSLAEGGASAVGEPTPLVLPPLHKLMPHVKPATSFSWSDDAGFHVQATSSFPGVTLLAAQSSNALSQQMTLIGLILPSLGEARQVATRTSTMSQASGLMIGMFTHAADHDDKLPPSLTDATFLQYVPSSMLKHPNDKSPMPRQIDKAWMQSQGAFVYVGPAGKKLSEIQRPFEHVVLYEHPRWADAKHINTAFADGSVRQLTVDELDEYLIKQTGKGYYETMQAEPAQPPAAP